MLWHMKKVVAVVRSLLLLVIIILAIASTPFEVFGSGDSMVPVRRIWKLVSATWIAIGWITIETAIGWFMALRRPKGPGASKDAPPAPPAPPAAEPPVAKDPAVSKQQ